MSFSTRPDTYAEALDRIKKTCPVGFDAPVRSHTADSPDEANTAWRKWGPRTNKSYETQNLAYLLGKSQAHKPGSFEDKLEQFIKSWEMETSNKSNFKDWKTVQGEHYKVTVGHDDGKGNIEWLKPVCAPAAASIGHYNIVFKGCPAYRYKDADPNCPYFEDSVELFNQGLAHLPFEILEAHKVNEGTTCFKMRHWGYWGGKGEVKRVNMTANVRIQTCPKTGKIFDMEIVLDADGFLANTVGDNTQDIDDKDFQSALAKALGKKDAHELTDLFIPKGKTLETV